MSFISINCYTSLFFSLLVMIGSWSCQSAESVSPIPEAELKDIITEALIMEPATRELPALLQDSVSTIVYSRILEERGYTMDDFIGAMAWLQQDADHLAKVYNEVIEKLTTLESELQ